jgi:hypothetical protein
MSTLYFDGEAGAAGDMILGALIALGLDHELLAQVVGPIAPAPFTLRVESVSINGVSAQRVHVDTAEEACHRSLPEIEALLERGGLSVAVKARSAAVFRRLATAEAQVHGSTPERVHFHEVGATDAVVDIVGACWGLTELGITSVFSSSLVLGSGLGRSAHGPIIYPAPAVIEILRGHPVRLESDLGETTTPTGAAILAEVAEFVDELMIVPEKVGYGAGHRTMADRPNLLRATMGVVPEVYDTDRVWLAASDIDNTRPEVFDWLVDRLRKAGAIDVTMTSVSMKKGRLGVRVEALCDAQDRTVVAAIILSETNTLGVRWLPVFRTKLSRRIESIETPWGPVRVKVADTSEGVRGVPEYDDCRRAAEESGDPLITIIDTVTRLHAQRHKLAGEKPERE